MVKKRLGIAISLGLALLFGLLSHSGEDGSSLAAPRASAAPAAPQARAPLAPGPAADLNLAFTAQVIGWIEPCG